MWRLARLNEGTLDVIQRHIVVLLQQRRKTEICLGFPSYGLFREREREVAQSCPTLRDPMDFSLPGSSVHGIFQARVLEWGAIAFSDE